MTDNYYGYTPVTIPGYAGAVDDYAYERSSQASPYEPTDWDAVTIEEMWEYVRKESDERTLALAATWRRTSSLLQATRENLKRHADSLDAKWQSPAARMFMGRVGATLYSLDEWRRVADDTATGLEQLATKIGQAQASMRQVWLDYKNEQIAQAGKREADQGLQWGDAFGMNNGKSYEEVQREFHTQARDIVKPLADLYIDVYISYVSRGGKFKGPTRAAPVNESLLPRPVAPGAPGGSRPTAPTATGPRPTRPDMPNRPDLVGTQATPPAPPPSGLPDDVRLAGTTAPTAPPTGAPPATPTLPTTTAPATAGPVVPPTALGPRPGSPGLSNAGNRPGTPRATLPGTGAGAPPGGRGPAPNRPTLPGTNAGGGTPGSGRGPAPNRPTLPGNTGTGRPPGSRPAAPGLGGQPGRTPPSTPRLPGSTGAPGRTGGAPGRPATPPPSLGGQRGGTPGTTPAAGRPTPPHPGKPGTGAGPAIPRSGAPLAGRGMGAPGAPHHGTPGARSGGQPVKGGQPDLKGRAAAGGGRAAPTTGPVPSLGGRRGGPTVPARASTRPADDEQETWQYGDGDDELWVTESTAVGAIEAPAEHRPREQGKALGQS
ncbi:PPE family [Micromonospora nigra]|uniref:PPE family n=1 Tax=Micromonospora nigra TaxID=145857 RepID=A0A1C6RWI6_9ACTN|nr:WXG100 family type VII secretion target [Micromonospora nigra]SCL21578.1 PPE family [Micromonospora nigra]